MLHFENNLTVLILLAFLCITFIQSALDKLINWKGNLEWLKGHFNKSFLKKYRAFFTGNYYCHGSHKRHFRYLGNDGYYSLQQTQRCR